MTTNGKILADSCVVIEFLEGNPGYSFIQDLFDSGSLYINEVILTELLPTMIANEIYAVADFTNKLPKVPMNINWKEIRDYQTILMKNGHSRIGIPDLLIAQNCIQNDIQVISCDKHFQTLAKFLPLKLK